MAQVVLRDYWRSSACYRVRIALAHLGIAYRKVPIDLLKGEQRAEDDRAINPQGLVPTLYNARRWGADISACKRLLDIDAECAKLSAFDAAFPRA